MLLERSERMPAGNLVGSPGQLLAKGGDPRSVVEDSSSNGTTLASTWRVSPTHGDPRQRVATLARSWRPSPVHGDPRQELATLFRAWRPSPGLGESIPRLATLARRKNALSKGRRHSCGSGESSRARGVLVSTAPGRAHGCCVGGPRGSAAAAVKVPGTRGRKSS